MMSYDEHLKFTISFSPLFHRYRSHFLNSVFLFSGQTQIWADGDKNISRRCRLSTDKLSPCNTIQLMTKVTLSLTVAYFLKFRTWVGVLLCITSIFQQYTCCWYITLLSIHHSTIKEQDTRIDIHWHWEQNI